MRLLTYSQLEIIKDWYIRRQREQEKNLVILITGDRMSGKTTLSHVISGIAGEDLVYSNEVSQAGFAQSGSVQVFENPHVNVHLDRLLIGECVREDEALTGLSSQIRGYLGIEEAAQ
jgi:hypothetical protein